MVTTDVEEILPGHAVGGTRGYFADSTYRNRFSGNRCRTFPPWKQLLLPPRFPFRQVCERCGRQRCHLGGARQSKSFWSDTPTPYVRSGQGAAWTVSKPDLIGLGDPFVHGPARTNPKKDPRMVVYPSVLFPFVSFATAILPFLSSGDVLRLEQVSVGDHRVTEYLWSLCARQIDTVTAATGHCPLMDCIREQTNPIWTAAATSWARHQLREFLAYYHYSKFKAYAAFVMRIKLDGDVTVDLAPAVIPNLRTAPSRNWRVHISAPNRPGVLALMSRCLETDCGSSDWIETSYGLEAVVWKILTRYVTADTDVRISPHPSYNDHNERLIDTWFGMGASKQLCVRLVTPASCDDLTWRLRTSGRTTPLSSHRLQITHA